MSIALADGVFFGLRAFDLRITCSAALVFSFFPGFAGAFCIGLAVGKI